MLPTKTVRFAGSSGVQKERKTLVEALRCTVLSRVAVKLKTLIKSATQREKTEEPPS